MSYGNGLYFFTVLVNKNLQSWARLLLSFDRFSKKQRLFFIVKQTDYWKNCAALTSRAPGPLPQVASWPPVTADAEQARSSLIILEKSGVVGLLKAEVKVAKKKLTTIWINNK